MVAAGQSRGPDRGDIHFVAFPDTGGNAVRGRHPAVVVQTARLRRSSTVIVVPMTSRSRIAVYDPPFLVPLAGVESGLRRDGFAKCDQPMTLPVALLGRRAGHLNDEAMRRVDAALRFVFDLR